MHEFEDAKDKVMMGAERRSMVMTEEEKQLTAYHEAGHAIVALNVPAADPVHKATIIPRGRALGMVMQLPEGDRYSMSYEQMTSRLAIADGRPRRRGADLRQGQGHLRRRLATSSRRPSWRARMVTRWGFSDELGRVAYGENQEEVFLGHSVARTQNVSEETAQMIDAEVRRLVDEGYDEARAHPDRASATTCRSLAKALLEYETLTGDEIKDLLKGKRPVREDPSDETARTHAARLRRADDRRQGRARKGDTGLEPQPLREHGE